MAARVILIGIGALFSIYCISVVILTFLGLNFAVFHLTNFFLVGFAAIYGVLTPFGISGIIGGYNRKKALLRSFIIQFWLASLILIGISVVSIFLAQSFRNDTIRRCQSDLFFQNNPKSTSCSDKVSSAQRATLIFAIVQGSILILFGIFVLIFGIRECKDILIEEEANSLIAKVDFKENKKEKASSPSNDRYSPTTPLHRNNSSNSNSSYASSNDDGYIDLGRDPNTISNVVPPRYNQEYVYPNGETPITPMPAQYTNIRRQPTNPTRIPSNRIPGSDLSRYPNAVNNVSTNRNPATVTLQATNGNDNYSQRAFTDDVYTSAPPRRPPMNPSRSLSAKKYNNQTNRIPVQYSSQSSPIPTVTTRNGQANNWNAYNDDYNDYNSYNYKYV
ncbi:6801_t:CDS:2 [Dentiscutata erythropus]|uniref:6801_t:CDS:1 n=1 Tax=Dentiscutata erythropus TaxID=1348616 RepID=A0A9N9GIU5_9GLOM|nr:6801_t:CDS:2 [Dentiscutata erythropus]